MDSNKWILKRQDDESLAVNEHQGWPQTGEVFGGRAVCGSQTMNYHDLSMNYHEFLAAKLVWCVRFVTW